MSTKSNVNPDSRVERILNNNNGNKKHMEKVTMESAAKKLAESCINRPQ